MWWALLAGLLLLFAWLIRNTLREWGFRIGYNVYTRNIGYYIFQKLVVKERMAHSQPFQMAINDRFTVVVIPVLSDNFSYMIIDQTAKEAVLVDPSHAEAVLDYIENHQVKITGILTTHYHWDHAGGNKSLHETLTNRQGRGSTIPIIGSDQIQQSSIACISQPVKDQEFFQIGNFVFQALYTPGHTTTDVVFVFYHITSVDAQESARSAAGRATSWSLFTGDVLFSAGCGKFFECSAEVMYNSLQRIKTIHSCRVGEGNVLLHKQECDEKTLIWPGHEYTLNNLRFVYSIDDRQAVTNALEWAQSQRSSLRVTVPSTLSKELQINPFLRADDSIYASLLESTPSEEELPIRTLAHLRYLKDNFVS